MSTVISSLIQRSTAQQVAICFWLLQGLENHCLVFGNYTIFNFCINLFILIQVHILSAMQNAWSANKSRDLQCSSSGWFTVAAQIKRAKCLLVEMICKVSLLNDLVSNLTKIAFYKSSWASVYWFRFWGLRHRVLHLHISYKILYFGYMEMKVETITLWRV